MVLCFVNRFSKQEIKITTSSKELVLPAPPPAAVGRHREVGRVQVASGVAADGREVRVAVGSKVPPPVCRPGVRLKRYDFVGL